MKRMHARAHHFSSNWLRLVGGTSSSWEVGRSCRRHLGTEQETNLAWRRAHLKTATLGSSKQPGSSCRELTATPLFFSLGRVLLLTVNRQHPVLWINTCNANLVYPNVFLSAGKCQFFEWHPFIMKDLSLHNTCSVSSHSATTLRQLTATFLTHIWYSKLAQTL